MEHRAKTRLLTVAVLLVVFGAGVLIGFAADSSLGAQPVDVVETDAADDSASATPRRRPMYLQLEPTSEQRLVIDSIVTAHRERTTALDRQTRATYRRGFREILLETREAIKGVFPAEKADEYQRLLDEWDGRDGAERESEDGRK